MTVTAVDGVDAVLFDLDDTLVAYRRTTGDVLTDAFERVGVDPFFPVEAYFERYDEFLARSDSIADLRRACFAAIAADRGRDPDLGRAVADAFNAMRDGSAVDLLPGAAAALDAFEGEYRLGIVTNGTPDVQRPKMRAHGIDRRVGTVVFAGHDAAPKPDPEPFRRALDALDVAPESAVHVGNSLASDVAGARAAGLRSVHVPAYPEDADVTPDYRLDSLRDLAPPPWRST